MNRFKIQHLALCAQGIVYQQYINSPEYLKNTSYGWALRGFTHLIAVISG